MIPRFPAILAVIVLASCDPHKPAAPAAPRQARTAPAGTLYVIKRFSVTTTYGLYGFSEGRKVTLLREENGICTVTDGTVKGRAPRSSFTDDLNAVDDLTGATTPSSADTAGTDARKHEKQTALLRLKIAEMDKRIASAKEERKLQGYPENGGPRPRAQGRYYYNGTYYNTPEDTATRPPSLSPDAAQIEKLLEAKFQLQRQLSSLAGN